MDQSLLVLEEVIGINTAEIKAKTESVQTSLLDEIGSIEEGLVGLELTDSSILQRIDVLQTQMEQHLKEPKFHLAFQDRVSYLYSGEATTDEFEVQGNYTNIYYNIYVENTGTTDYYYTWITIKVYDQLGALKGALFLEGNEHVRNLEQFCGILSLNLVPDTYYIKIEANAKNFIWNYNLAVWDYY